MSKDLKIKDQKLFEKIKQSALDSLKNPGKSTQKLPKAESPTNPEIIVFRHGQTHDNINKIFSGWRDTDLTETGIKQAQMLAKLLKEKQIDLCITSPLKRSKKTAEIALKYHKDVLFEEDPRIIERNYGTLTGTSKQKLTEQNPELAIRYRRSYDFPPPQGESYKMVEERVFKFCDELVTRVKKQNINVVVCCHGNSMRAIRKYFEKLPLIDTLTIENPLGKDFAMYVVKNHDFVKSQKGLSLSYIKKLFVPNKKILSKLIRNQ